MATLAPKYLSCVVAIGYPQKMGDPSWNATGFLLGYCMDEKKKIEKVSNYAVFLITNRHVLEGQNNVILRFNPKGNGKWTFYLQTRII